MATAKELFQISKETLRTAEELAELAKEQVEKAVDNDIEFIRIDDRSLIEVLRDNPEEKMLPIEDIEQNFFERRESEFIDGYKEQDTTKKAEIFIKDKFDIDADYRKIPLDVANMMNRELVRARNMFGTCGLVEKIIPDDGRLKPGDFASYNPVTKTITLRTDRGVVATNLIVRKQPTDWFSTNEEGHIYMHEIGHAMFNYFENLWTDKANDPISIQSQRNKEVIEALENIHHEYFTHSEEGFTSLSKYSCKDYKEMVAEAFVQLSTGKPSKLATIIWNIIKEA